MSRPTFDARDAEILATSVEAFNKRSGPRVGDWCRMPDGEMRRFTHAWSDGIQTTMNKVSGLGSFHFSRQGYMEYSGGLYPAIPREKLIDTGETKPATVWFFHHNEARAHNGVYAEIECRIYRVQS